MAPKQPAESSAVKYTEPERTCLITEGKWVEYFLVGKNDNEMQKPLIVSFKLGESNERGALL